MIVELFNAVLYASVVGCIAAALVLLFKLIFRRYFTARWHYWIWFILLLRLLLPVSIGGPFSLISALNVPDKNTVVKTYTVALSPSAYTQQPAAPQNTAGNKKSAQTENSTFSLSSVPALIWACVASALLIYTVTGYTVFSARVHKLPKCDDERVNRIFKACKDGIGIKRAVNLSYMRSSSSPALTGIIHPSVIISPATAQSLNDIELRHIFMHELSHLKSHDIPIGLIITLTGIVHWFNPIVLICIRLMKIDCEAACDAAALHYFEPGDRLQYGQTIVKLCEIYSRRGLRPWVTGIAGKGQIKRRIRMIRNFKKASAIATCLAVIMTLFIGCSALTEKKAITPITKNQITYKNVTSLPAESKTSLPAENEISLSGFSSIKSYVKTTLFENVEGEIKNTAVKGSYDLNGDGKAENISVNFASLGNGGKTTISVESSKCETDISSLAGVYAIDLDKSDKYTELAVVANQMDTDTEIMIYRYDGSLTLLGKVYGSLYDQPGYGYSLTAYNIGVLADGKGRLIPRRGVIRYIAPQIMLSVYEIENSQIAPVKLDFSKEQGISYTVTTEVRPYFEEMPPNAQLEDPMPLSLQFNDKDKITLKTGSIITFKAIKPTLDDSLCSIVELQDKRTGILYFFVHP